MAKPQSDLTQDRAKSLRWSSKRRGQRPWVKPYLIGANMANWKPIDHQCTINIQCSILDSCRHLIQGISTSRMCLEIDRSKTLRTWRGDIDKTSRGKTHRIVTGWTEFSRWRRVWRRDSMRHSRMAIFLCHWRRLSRSWDDWWRWTLRMKTRLAELNCWGKSKAASWRVETRTHRTPICS